MSYDEYINVQATGEDFSVEPADDRRPFRALLDVGLISGLQLATVSLVPLRY